MEFSMRRHPMCNSPMRTPWCMSQLRTTTMTGLFKQTTSALQKLSRIRPTKTILKIRFPDNPLTQWRKEELTYNTTQVRSIHSWVKEMECNCQQLSKISIKMLKEESSKGSESWAGRDQHAKNSDYQVELNQSVRLLCRRTRSTLLRGKEAKSWQHKPSTMHNIFQYRNQ